ncbi:MAG TPA: helix-turn-helix domain-containing protein [Streptomyces sp.]
MSVPTLETFFTSAEVAKALRMDIQTLRRKAFSGEIDSVKSGREYRFTQAHIDAYLSGDKPAPRRETKPLRSPRYSN